MSFHDQCLGNNIGAQRKSKVLGTLLLFPEAKTEVRRRDDGVGEGSTKI